MIPPTLSPPVTSDPLEDALIDDSTSATASRSFSAGQRHRRSDSAILSSSSTFESVDSVDHIMTTPRGPQPAVARRRVTFADVTGGVRDVGVTSSSKRRAYIDHQAVERNAAAKRSKREPVTSTNQTSSAINEEVFSPDACDVINIMPLQSIDYNTERLRPVVTSSQVTCSDVTSSSQIHQSDRLSPIIPADPRVWSRTDVCNWLALMRESRDVEVDAERFRMNGKALCLMTREMFAFRVPQSGAGLILYKDFQTRLCRAVAVSLHRSCAAGQ